MPAGVPLHAVRESLGPGREAWLGPAERDARAPAGMERHLLDLQLPLGDRGRLITFHKATYVDVGPLRGEGTTAGVEISWRAATLAPLFPVFSGRLEWTDGDLRLDGVYAPPGGGAGMVADRLLLNVAARGTGRWLLERVVAAMRAAATRG
jgi:hypothetical protein